MSNLICLIMFVGLSIFVFFLFLFILKREKEIEQKFLSFELSLEKLQQEVYLLKKENNIDSVYKDMEKIEKIVDSIVDDVRIIESKNIEIIESLREEIKELKNEVKKSKLPEISSVNKSDEEKIISMYKSGYSIEDISKLLRIPIGEVELIVKFSSF